MKKLTVFFGILLSLILFVSCGDTGSVQETETGEDESPVLEYTFRESVSPDFLPPGGDFNGIQVTAGALCVGSGAYDEEKQSFNQTLLFLSLEDMGEVLSETQLSMDFSELQGGIDFAGAVWYVDGAGNIHTAVTLRRNSAGELGGIFQFAPDGTLLAEKKNLGTPEGFRSIQNLAVDAEGNVFLLFSVGEAENQREEIQIFQPDGKIRHLEEIGEASPYEIFAGGDGFVYAACENDRSIGSLSRLSGEGKSLETWNNFPAGDSDRICPETAGTLLYADNSGVNRYDMKTKEAARLFSWLDYDLSADWIFWLSADGNGNLCAAQMNYDTFLPTFIHFGPQTEEASGSSPGEDEAEGPVRLVVGTLYDTNTLRELVLAFNTSQSDYHVEIESYLQTHDWSPEEYSAQEERLNMDLATGSHEFDLIALSYNLDLQNLMKQGILEDLYPYLDGSQTLDREDLFESVLISGTVDGKLAYLTRTFDIECLMGRKSLLGDRTGWTLRELLDFAKEYPDARLFSTSRRWNIMQYLLSYGTDLFIDMEGDTPVFDAQLCADLLEMLKKNGDLADSEEKPEPRMLQDEEALLVCAHIWDIDQIRLYLDGYFELEPITATGFPTPDGQNGLYLTASGLDPGELCILSSSQHKEGAWAFLEYSLRVGAYDGRYISGGGFPSLKEDFDREMEAAVKDQYSLDEEGNVILDQNGNPELKSHRRLEIDDWSYDYAAVEEEDVELIRELLSRGAHPHQKMSDTVYDIFREESDAYFAGQKSLEDTVDVMEKRMMLYYSENYEW